MSESYSTHSRQPVVNLPGVVTGFILLLAAIHLWRSFMLTPQEDVEFLLDYALIPARWTIAFMSDGFDAVMRSIGEGGGDVQWRMAVAQFLQREGEARLWTGLTHAFLHDSWMHFGFNAIWLAVFGAPLARRWGNARFIVFSVLTALTGALMHFIAQPYSVVPTIGASGIVSGMFGAASWYVFDRRFGGVAQDHSTRPRFTLAEIVTNPTTVAFIVFWFIGNYAFAAMPGALTGDHVEIAWLAHVGGFLGGFVLFPLLDRRRKAEDP